MTPTPPDGDADDLRRLLARQHVPPPSDALVERITADLRDEVTRRRPHGHGPRSGAHRFDPALRSPRRSRGPLVAAAALLAVTLCTPPLLHTVLRPGLDPVTEADTNTVTAGRPVAPAALTLTRTRRTVTVVATGTAYHRDTLATQAHTLLDTRATTRRPSTPGAPSQATVTACLRSLPLDASRVVVDTAHLDGAPALVITVSDPPTTGETSPTGGLVVVVPRDCGRAHVTPLAGPVPLA